MGAVWLYDLPDVIAGAGLRRRNVGRLGNPLEVVGRVRRAARRVLSSHGIEHEPG